MNQQQLGFKILFRIKSLGIAALVFGAAILFFACENNLEQIKAFSSQENLPIAEAKNFEQLKTDSGEVRYFLKAPTLLQFENDGNAYLEFPDGIELIQYDENNRITSSITASYAKQFVDRKEWEAKNNVIASNADGDTLKTEQLIYEEESGKIYTNEFVRIIKPDQITTGTGFESDGSMQNWKIKNPKASLYISVDSKKNEKPISRENSNEFNNLDEGSKNKQLELQKLNLE